MGYTKSDAEKDRATEMEMDARDEGGDTRPRPMLTRTRTIKVEIEFDIDEEIALNDECEEADDADLPCDAEERVESIIAELIGVQLTEGRKDYSGWEDYWAGTHGLGGWSSGHAKIKVHAPRTIKVTEAV